jgi:hypothetical protein
MSPGAENDVMKQYLAGGFLSPDGPVGGEFE